MPRIPPHNALDISEWVIIQEMSRSNIKYLIIHMISLLCDRLANIAIPITVAACRGHRGRLDYSYAEEGG